ncbi:MAG: LLM class flavin-dependent oxidoreductase, partial [Deltaproteobacteria bacterium]|nr:LLM class flavin-dependent oxidoreductase [Deltaproteobacteria bacterium]
DGPVDFAGEHFQVSGFEGRPKPLQRPHPPLMIGGGGKRVLSLAGREADIVSFNFNNRSGTLGTDGPRNSTGRVLHLRRRPGRRHGRRHGGSLRAQRRRNARAPARPVRLGRQHL